MKNKNDGTHGNTKESASLSNILSAISDDKFLALFRTITVENGDDGSDSEFLTSKIKLTRKQYYSRMSRMTKVGLIQRKNGKYFLTSLGKVVYNNLLIIESALSNYWKLKAIDSFEIVTAPEEERNKIIDDLIDDCQIKDILAEGFGK
jgi:hypothetical protein